jgi:hypothetical protein
MKSLFCSYYFVFQFAERKTQNEFEGALAHIHACMRTEGGSTAEAFFPYRFDLCWLRRAHAFYFRLLGRFFSNSLLLLEK